MKIEIISIVVMAVLFLLCPWYINVRKYYSNFPTAVLFESDNLEFVFPLQNSKQEENIVRLKRNHRYLVSPGDIVSGDILEKYESRDWYVLHDNYADTTLLVVVQWGERLIFAPYGATIYKKGCGVSIETLKKEKLDEGFSEVIIKTI